MYSKPLRRQGPTARPWYEPRITSGVSQIPRLLLPFPKHEPVHTLGELRRVGG